MLETIREYARERLVASGEADAVARRLAETAACCGGDVRGRARPGRADGLAQLEDELDNIRAAIRVAVDWTGDTLALRLTAALAWFWNACGGPPKGYAGRSRRSNEAGAVSGPVRAEGLRAAAMLATLAADDEQARALGEEALALYRAAGDDNGWPRPALARARPPADRRPGRGADTPRGEHRVVGTAG